MVVSQEATWGGVNMQSRVSTSGLRGIYLARKGRFPKHLWVVCRE